MKIFVGLLLAIFVAIAGISFTSPPTRGQKEQRDDKPTVVQKGQITEKEREYSKEYEKLYSDRNGLKLTAMSESGEREGKEQEIGVSIGVPTIPTIGSSSPTNNSNLLKDLSCKADAVVIGLVNNKTAHLTVDETFIYTEYEFSVEDVLKNNSSSPIEVNKSIQITRPGGLIKLDGQVVRVEDKSYEPLQTKKKYLLFLRSVPSADGYIVSDARGDFLLENNSFKKLSKITSPEGLKDGSDVRTLFNNVRDSISTGCEQRLTGGN